MEMERKCLCPFPHNLKKNADPRRAYGQLKMAGDDIENASAKAGSAPEAAAVVDNGPTFDEQRILDLLAKQNDQRRIEELESQLEATRHNARLHASRGGGGGVNLQMGGQTTSTTAAVAASSGSGGGSDKECADYLCMSAWKCVCTIIAVIIIISIIGGILSGGS
eukprot:scaffold23497_cov106-Cylindrotheca_fusiformis.AAC.6